MKTIFILSHINDDGSLYCSFVHDHAKALAKNNKVIVLAVNSYFPFLKKKIAKKTIHSDGVEIKYVNRISISNFLHNSNINLNGFLYYLIAKRELKKILKNNHVDLIDAHTYKIEGYAAYLLKKKYGINTCVTLHGTSFNRNFKTKNGRKEIKKISQKIDNYICVSRKIAKNLDDLKIKNYKLIYNGINYFHIKSTQKEQYSIVTVANLTKVKNIDVVINSFKQILKIYPNAMLTIIGNGELKSSLEEQAKNIKNIKFTGYLKNNEVQELLNKAEIFVLPSSPEGFGIVYPEAMHNGCITIGTKGEGIDGFIKNGENGFLVDVDANQISELIIDIFNGKYDTKKIITKAKSDSSKLTWEENALNYIKLIQEEK